MPSLTDSPAATAAELPAAEPRVAELPTADDVVTHTLLNCLLREVSGPERQTVVDNGHLLLRLPRRGVLLRVSLRRTSLLGAHRFSGPVSEQAGDGWAVVDWRRLAEYTRDELSLRTGERNDEFLDQITSSHQAITTALAHERPATRPADHPASHLAAYLASEQSLLFGHRFHPTPKARTGDPRAWAAYAPETGAVFPLRHLAVRAHLIAEETAAPGPPLPSTVSARTSPTATGCCRHTPGSTRPCANTRCCGPRWSAVMSWTSARADAPSPRPRPCGPCTTARRSSSSA